jgi:hypothetical protein
MMCESLSVKRTVALALFGFFSSLLCDSHTTAQERISPAEAAKHVGNTATVCGQVASTNFAARSQPGPTFLNLVDT